MNCSKITVGITAVIAVWHACAQDTACAQSQNYSTESIERLNLEFREMYALARQKRLVNLTPVVIARGDNTILMHRGARYVGRTVHPNYHDLKTISHVPLAMFCALSGNLDSPISPTVAKKLQAFRSSVQDALQGVPKAFRNSGSRDRQTDMLSKSLAFMSTVSKNGVCTKKELDAFIDKMRPAVLRNVEEATKLRIDNYHQQMLEWRSEMTEEEWNALYVVIPGAALPRKNSMAVQYFAKLLREPGEGRRIIYAESQFDESKDMLLLGTHLLDAEVGIAFFGDPWRMRRDLLASAADSYLDTLDFDDFYVSQVTDR